MVSGKINSRNIVFINQLIELICHFYASLTIIRLYPPEHNLVLKKTKNLHKILTDLLKYRKILQFGIAKNDLFFVGTPLGKTNPACTSFANLFSEHDIAEISFHQGITLQSLSRFLVAASVPSSGKEKEVKFEEEIATLKISNISVRSYDYSEFDVANSKKKKRRMRGTGTEQDDETSVWGLYAKILRDKWLKRHSGSQKAWEVERSDDFSNPIALASFLNTHAQTDKQTVTDFALLVDEMLEETNGQPAGMCQTTGELLNSVLTHLDPLIRGQFLSTTLKTIDATSSEGDPEYLLKGLSKNMLTGMMELVNQGNVTISQALFNLIERISHLDIPLTIQPEALNKRQLHALLQPERYKDFIDEEYHVSLQKLSQKQSLTKASLTGFPLEKYLPTMEDNYIDEKITRATLCLLDDIQDVSEYEHLAEYIVDFSYELPRIGSVTLLSAIQTTLQRHSKENQSEDIRKLALEYLKELSEDEFVECVVRALPELSHKKQNQLLTFLIQQGSAPVEALLHIFCLQTKTPTISHLFKVFAESRIDTLATIFKILPSQNIGTVKKLLSLVQQLGVGGTVPLLKRLLQNDEEAIRFAVLKLLLPLEEKEAIDLVCTMLNSNQDARVDSAIDLCGLYRVSSMVPLLVKLLDDQLYKKEIFKRNSRLILALGAIGDKRAIPYLTKLVQSKFSFLPNRLAHMKETIFSTLKAYKPSARKKLLIIGLQSKEKKIRSICQQIEFADKQDKNGRRA